MIYLLLIFTITHGPYPAVTQVNHNFHSAAECQRAGELVMTSLTLEGEHWGQHFLCLGVKP